MLSEIANYLNNHGLNIRIVNPRRGPKCELAELVWKGKNQSQELKRIIPQMIRDLGCKSVITEPIEETENLVLEIPAEHEHLLDFSALISHEAFKNTHAALPICLGTDTGGNPQVFDLYQLRHLLLMGKSDCGKTSTLKTIILSLILKKSSEEIKIALFNSSGEFKTYDQQKYLLTPIIENSKEAQELLVWLCEEVERRRLIFQKSGSHHIRDYHNHVGTLPYIIVVLDEFSDLLEKESMSEKYLSLLLQKGGSCGIFLVMSASSPNYEKLSFLQRSDFVSALIYQISPSEFLKEFLQSENPEYLLARGDAWLNICKSSLTRIHTSIIEPEYVKRTLLPYQKELFALPLDQYQSNTISIETHSIWKKIANWLK